MAEPKILLAPLQGFTEYHYRNIVHSTIGGIDNFYSPFIRLDNEKKFRTKDLKDIAKENNLIPLVPQVLVNNSGDFLKAANYISDQGYECVNLNLGCPYPMVTNRKLGSGLLPYPEMIKTMLEETIQKTSLQISIKMRLGLTDSTEIEKIIPVLNDFPLQHIIIHPRIAKQLYKGDLNLDQLRKCIKTSNHKMIYNGDIVDIDSFKTIKGLFPEINEFMIGRGLLANPTLVLEIKNGSALAPDKKLSLLQAMHDQLIIKYIETYSGETQILQKTLAFWTYFSSNFNPAHKVLKQIKKSKNLKQYHLAVDHIFTNYYNL